MLIARDQKASLSRRFTKSLQSSAVSLLWMVLLAMPKSAQAQQLRQGSEFAEKGCYARLDGNELVIGNSHVRRTWRIEHGEFVAISFFDVDQQLEWIEAPAKLSPSDVLRREESGKAVLRGGSGVYGPTEAESLRVELELGNTVDSVRYEFQVFPDASAIRVWLDVKTPRRLATTAESFSQVAVNADAIEQLHITNPHLRLTQVTLRDRTDDRDELVFENEWLLHPNESLLQLKGNVFIVEDTLSGNGFVFLKESPEPDMRPLPIPFDCRFSGSGMSARKRGDSDSFPYFDLSFYGNDLATAGRGYPFALIAYHGGRTGRIAAMQRYQRQIRQYVAGRDGLLLSNTWGDRSGDSKLNENFIDREIDAGKALGVDVVQVDAGWQTGKATGTTGGGGVWDRYWETDPHFWDPDGHRFPHRISSVSEYAHARGIRLGLWFAPDSYEDFVNWHKDADQLLAWYRDEHVDAFKLDSVKIGSKDGETNYHALVDTVMKEASAKILLDLDVTAETRQGYFGNVAAGPLFVENRYTDWHRYWPHQTLRNFWRLAQYVDPLRLRMEFLNSERNTTLYEGDPLAPSRYRPSCLFAITMFGSPLGWFENTGLSPGYVADAAPLIARWKGERDAIYHGTILPIGEVPDGRSWTGFASVAEGGGGGSLLVFRELNEQSTWEAPRSLFASGKYRIQVLGGEGEIKETTAGFEVHIPEQLGFVWARLDAVH